MVMLTDRPDTTLDVYCGRKTTIQQQLTKVSSLPIESSCLLFNEGWLLKNGFALLGENSSLYE